MEWDPISEEQFLRNRVEAASLWLNSNEEMDGFQAIRDILDTYLNAPIDGAAPNVVDMESLLEVVTSIEDIQMEQLDTVKSTPSKRKNAVKEFNWPAELLDSAFHVACMMLTCHILELLGDKNENGVVKDEVMNTYQPKIVDPTTGQLKWNKSFILRFVLYAACSCFTQFAFDTYEASRQKKIEAKLLQDMDDIERKQITRGSWMHAIFTNPSFKGIVSGLIVYLASKLTKLGISKKEYKPKEAEVIIINRYFPVFVSFKR